MGGSRLNNQFSGMQINQNNVLDAHFPNNYSNISHTGKQGNNKGELYEKQKMAIKQVFEHVSLNQQCSVINYGDSVTLTHRQKIITDHSDAILCVLMVGESHIATGSKDKTINIYSLGGDKEATLRGHNSAICCLAVIRNIHGELYLASGSDHGCSSLIIWDSQSWAMYTKAVYHSAAVTSIVDLEDGHHLVTGSYDKKINLFNHIQAKL